MKVHTLLRIELIRKMSTGLTLISLNVRGIREKVKRKRILEWCKNKRGILFFTGDIQHTRCRRQVEVGVGRIDIF